MASARRATIIRMNKKEKLEKHRIDTLSDIVGSRLNVELMAQRPRRADDVLNSQLFETVVKKLMDIEERAKRASNEDDLDDLDDDAESQEHFSSYFCPAAQIEDEGNLTIDLVEGWGIPVFRNRRSKSCANHWAGN
jgi:hypothetical protein